MCYRDSEESLLACRFILFSNVFVFSYMTILYALLVLLVKMLATTIISLYDLTTLREEFS